MKTAERERERVLFPLLAKRRGRERNCTPNTERDRPEKSKKKKITKLYRTAGEVPS